MFQNILYYHQHKEELSKNYQDRYLIIKDEQVVGHYNSWSEAYLVACRLFQNDNFFIKHCCS